MAKSTLNKRDAKRELKESRRKLDAAIAKFVKAELERGTDLATLAASLREVLLEGAAKALGQDETSQLARDGAATDGHGSEQTVEKRSARRSSSKQPARFTERQGKYLAFIDAYTRLHGRPPAQTDIQRYFRVSPPSVHQMVLTLERRGLLHRTPGEARSLEVLVPLEELPILPILR